MAGRPGSRALVIGVGNDFRSDDGAGLAVARLLKARRRDGLAVLEHTGEVAGLLEAWRGADTVILVDAVVTGAAAGTIHRFDPRARDFPRECFQCSTHAFGIPEALALGRALNLLPPRLVVFGVEARDFAPGGALSGEVERAARQAAERILQEIGDAEAGVTGRG
jgi:hydrogenase maturation protease